MSIGSTKTDVYTDFAGLAQLRLNGQSNPDETLRAAGRQFESLFIQMMLKSMRDASPGDSLLGGHEQDTYRDMFDKQISLTLAAKGSLGLAEAMVRQLGQRAPVSPGAAHSDADAQSPSLGRAGASPSSMPSTSGTANMPLPPASVNVSTTQDDERRGFATREEFVAAMWPAAQASARELGVDPRVLIAQAALETGWGRAVMQHGDGRSSHNLFGIKAGNNWSGASVNVATLEYRDGLAAKERANFRSYDSYEQSFADYVDFIKSQPRYREALAHGGDAKRYLSGLQSAGYATDPRYADKIGSILQGETLSGRSGDLTGSGGGPIA